MLRPSGRRRNRACKGGVSRSVEATFHASVSCTRLTRPYDARTNSETTRVTESSSVDDVTSDRTSNEKEGGNTMETEAGGDSGASKGTRTADDSSSGGSSEYPASSPTLSGTQNSDEDIGVPHERDPQGSKQPMAAMTPRQRGEAAEKPSPSTTATSAPTRQIARFRNSQHLAKLRPDATSEKSVYTFMLRQIPRHYTQLTFLIDVSRHGFVGLVDFIYIQFDSRKGKNVGYGFIGFTESAHARAFSQRFDGVHMGTETGEQGRPLRIHPAAVQGYANNLAHFAQARANAEHCSAPLFMPRGSWRGLPRPSGSCWRSGRRPALCGRSRPRARGRCPARRTPRSARTSPWPRPPRGCCRRPGCFGRRTGLPRARSAAPLGPCRTARVLAAACARSRWRRTPAEGASEPLRSRRPAPPRHPGGPTLDEPRCWRWGVERPWLARACHGAGHGPAAHGSVPAARGEEAGLAAGARRGARAAAAHSGGLHAGPDGEPLAPAAAVADLQLRRAWSGDPVRPGRRRLGPDVTAPPPPAIATASIGSSAFLSASPGPSCACPPRQLLHGTGASRSRCPWRRARRASCRERPWAQSARDWRMSATLLPSFLSQRRAENFCSW
ncbi:unnamed protein product [Prorocentrum cordatum]|uniref:RRM domain-containing protein n=1 Tax=Prorocentrum cordatum TaxID=2364126 RepID=A0ABN9QHB0_9DINO|nr:unnamed protein product [Polarella glacialis]